MTKQSQLRRWTSLIAALVASLLLGSCESDRVCGAMACPEGLSIVFRGNYAVGQSYAIVISTQTQEETVPIMTCVLEASAGLGPQLLCSSALDHTADGNTIRFRDYQDLLTVRVSVSLQGTSVGEQTFTPSYTSREINGEGCGVCHSGSIDVAFP